MTTGTRSGGMITDSPGNCFMIHAPQVSIGVVTDRSSFNHCATAVHNGARYGWLRLKRSTCSNAYRGIMHQNCRRSAMEHRLQLPSQPFHVPRLCYVFMDERASAARILPRG